MGGAISHLIPCLNPDVVDDVRKHHAPPQDHRNLDQNDIVYSAEEPLDETLGHSFCYVRSSARFLSPTSSDRFLNSHSFRFDDPPPPPPRAAVARPEPVFRAISGASVSANSATNPSACAASVVVNGFDCTASFTAVPLQPVPRGDHHTTAGSFLSGPIERGAMSGPLDSSSVSDMGRIPFSAPLSVGGGGDHTSSSNYNNSNSGVYKKRRKNSFAGIKRSLYRSFSEKKRPWVVPVGRKEVGDSSGAGGGGGGGGGSEDGIKRESEIDGSNVQWALGKAGEDRVHVVVSEDHGWLFIGIYDGFNGPDAPEFLMCHLYRAVFNELKGLFWDDGDDNAGDVEQGGSVGNEVGEIVSVVDGDGEVEEESRGVGAVKRVTFLKDGERKETRRKLWEFLAENDPEDGLDLSGSDRFAFSVDDAVRVSNAGTRMSRRSLMLSKLKQGWSRSNTKGGLFHWRFKVGEKDKVDAENRVEAEEGVEAGRVCSNGTRRKTGPVDHELVLRALAQALEKTEHAYLDLTERVIDRYPELALMGSCLLVVLMRDEDVYVMNLGDSRAIVAHSEHEGSCSNVGSNEKIESSSSIEGIVEECISVGEKSSNVPREFPLEAMKLTALQLSTDHSTSIVEEVKRIKREHPDDNHCIVNDRVKGRLKVTRAFGAGFLKQAKFNDSLLEMFRNEFIGAAPYVSCIPSLCHHQLGPRDHFLVLSSDGLNQYLTNQEVVSFVENFMEKYPDGDPAQHLIEELLNRAAKKAGMDFHDLLDIPQGDRRKYHDDVTVMVISLEGRIWKSSGKYP
ncbi:hypothetical protein RND81_13G017000 [Saponaria officinalis]|uniref:PPM-type phosphatase domain-containing protein n=1 Tax=Saponaria officinalis TaxID=3572 RepID=A0AAW1GV26_SAPOF